MLPFACQAGNDAGCTLLSLGPAAQLQEGIDEEYQIMYVGCLSVEIDPMDQDVRYFSRSSSWLWLHK